jgi:hypothetical protein
MISVRKRRGVSHADMWSDFRVRRLVVAKMRFNAALLVYYYPLFGALIPLLFIQSTWIPKMADEVVPPKIS